MATLASPNVELTTGGHHATHRPSYGSHPFSSKSTIEMQQLGKDVESQHYPDHEHGEGKAHHHHAHMHSITGRVEERYHRLTDKVEDQITKGQSRRKVMWDRFRGKTRRKIGWLESASNTIKSSALNVLLIFVPLAWISFFFIHSPLVTFALSFVAIIPLARLFEFGGDQMALYTGKDLGDLVVVTLNNMVEALLAIILLLKCDLRILQSTIIGVVLLHLLLVPGMGFLVGGATVHEQTLHPEHAQLNHSLLTIGVLSLIIPVSFISALDTDASSENILLSSDYRHKFLMISIAISVVLLSVYISSRIFLHNPPGEVQGTDHNAPLEILHEEMHLEQEEAYVNPWFCSIVLVITIAVTAITAEMLVESVEHVRDLGGMSEEWFGLILLPMVSYSADGFVAVMYFTRKLLLGKPRPPKLLAEIRAISLSIQFMLFWMPVFVIIGVCTQKHLMLVFDLYEVGVLVGACFLVNYVTADAKTNWAEGYILVAFYIMIAACTWFYEGQEIIHVMAQNCAAGSALAHGEGSANGEH